MLVTARPVLASSPSLSGVCFKFSVIIKQLQASKSSRRAPASDCRPLLHRFPIVSSALHNLRISSQLYFVRREPESLLLPNPNGFPNLVLSKSIPKAWGGECGTRVRDGIQVSWQQVWGGRGEKAHYSLLPWHHSVLTFCYLCEYQRQDNDAKCKEESLWKRLLFYSG